MGNPRPIQLRAIFDEAAERPVADRAGYVHSACDGDTTLEREIMSLLMAMENQSGTLDADAATWLADAAGETLPTAGSTPGAPPATPADTELHGIVVGDFRLLRLIGRGAMGSVYEAQQISLKRQVAVKILQAWTATGEARRRFIEESSILARLRHPGIAHVIAAGSRRLELGGPDQKVAEGLFNDLHSVPWIAMELVHGAKTVLDFCRGKSLSTENTLGLFAHVCDAVHHGHQQGVIHRDLKPANILVDAHGQAKVIDFGIARAISVGSAIASAQTIAGGFMGSLRYMSPEQCDGRGAPIDTRSDVYSLGVVLYESLTGHMPYPVDDTSFASAARAVCETAPKDPRPLRASISSDAAIVLLKALRKDPASRYQSASELAADLRRVLKREPVRARPASFLYTIGMLARRRPAITALAVAAVLGFFVGIIGITVGLAHEQAARSAAERTAWLANLTAADSNLRLGDGGSALRRLEAIPPGLRGWEWRYLSARADTSADCWQYVGGNVGGIGGTSLSPSGLFATVRLTGDRVNLIDNRTRALLRTIEGVPTSGSPSWSPDERFIAFAGEGEVAIADMHTGIVTQRLKLPRGGASLGTGWSPDGSLIAVGCTHSPGVVVFRIDTGEHLFEHQPEGWIYQPAFSPDGQTLAWSDLDRAVVVDTATWTVTRTVPTRRNSEYEPSPACFSPDGQTLAVPCGIEAELIDIPSGSVRAVLRGHQQRIHSIAFDATGRRIVTTSIDKTVRIWDARSGAPITTLLGHEYPTWAAQFTTTGPAATPTIISADAQNRVRIWNLQAGRPTFQAQFPRCRDYIGQLDFSADSTRLRAFGWASLATIDLGDYPAVLPTAANAENSGCILPHTPLIAQMIEPARIIVEDPETHTQRWSCQLESEAPTIIPSPDGTMIAALLRAGPVVIVSVADGTEVGRVNIGGVRVYTAAFDHDGTTIATLDERGSVKLWDTRSLAQRVELAPNGERGQMLCWSDDGSILVYAHVADGITLWNARTRKEIRRIEAIGGQVWSAAISPDQSRLAVGAQDRVTHLFELPGGEELLQLRDHTGTVMSVAWSPDGRYLATGGYDKRVVVHDSQRAR